MKNITKRIIALFAVLAVAASSFAGCGSKKTDGDNSDTSSAANSAPMQYPFVVGEAAEGNGITPGDPNGDLNADDPVAAPEKPDPSSESSSADNSGSEAEADAEPETEIVEVTEPDGEPATMYVPVTDAEGQKMTEPSGEEATTAVKVTQIVTKPAANNTQTATQAPAPTYTAKEDGRYAMWLDISKNENFYFEDDMILAAFKVKEGIPDGDYKIRISPDLSDIAGVAIYPSKVIDGTIRVNNGSIEAVDVSNETGMVFYGDNIACKQGDEIEFNINIKNNSGLAAFCIWFYYDSNALEFIEAVPAGKFKEIARNTEIGGEQTE